jgi:uncharacterized protein (DUF58 family)
MALTRKAVAYLALAYLFVGLALVFREPTLTAFVIPLAVAFFYSSFFTETRMPDLTIKRRLNPPRSFGGESITVTLQVRNNSSAEIGELQLEDTLSESLALEGGTNNLTAFLRAGELLEHTYKISAPKRGRYQIGPMKMKSEDMLAFREYSTTLSSLDHLLILPKVEDLGSIELRARRVGPWPGSVQSRSVGPGSEFFELRQYIPGDELRRINWKATAKRARLLSNEYEGERVTDVLVVLDCSESARSQLFSFDAEEFEVDFAASLCSQLLLQGNRVGLLVYGAERTWLAPAFGKRQLLKILGSLAIVRAGSALVPIGYAVETIVAAVLPTRSVIVFISPLVGDDVAESVSNVASAGYSVVCFSPTTGPSASKLEPSARAMARRIMAAERRINVNRIVAIAKFFELSPHTSIRLLLRSRRSLWRRI